MTRASTDDKSSTQGQHKAPIRRLIKKEGGRRPPSKMTRLATDDKTSHKGQEQHPRTTQGPEVNVNQTATVDKSSTQGQHKAPIRRLIKKEGGRRPPSKMTRLATDDKTSHKGQEQHPRTTQGPEVNVNQTPTVRVLCWGHVFYIGFRRVDRSRV